MNAPCAPAPEHSRVASASGVRDTSETFSPTNGLTASGLWAYKSATEIAEQCGFDQCLELFAQREELQREVLDLTDHPSSDTNH